ncbi:MAG: glycosyltransferase family 4 protein [Candidatus Poseidoniaceae archaeon]
MKILHVLANSSPDINGYAIRTQMILQYQRELDGLDNTALTSPWYPNRESMTKEHTSHGVQYYRTKHPSRQRNRKLSLRLVKKVNKKMNPLDKIKNASPQSSSKRKRIKRISGAFSYFFRIGWKVVEEKILIKYFTKRIIEVAKQNNAEIIHAHTPYRVGLPALKAARKLGLPFVYEMRGMWEETAVANGRWLRNGPAYRRFQNYETKVLRKADSVICISETLKKEAISRGVNPEKITVVTNAVEKDMSKKKSKSSSLKSAKESLNASKTTKVVGYIGSLREMEGVDLTAKAVAKLVEKDHDIRFFVLTGENGQAELRALCKKLGIADKSTIMGPVPHEEVPVFYDLIDLFIVSRPETRVTKLVTPLKPFEAMAMGKAVIASKLPALEEIIQHEKTGLLYTPDNLESLVDSIEKCIQDDDLTKSLGDSAKDWIKENRTWDIVVKNSLKAYEIAKAGK